MWLDGKEQDNLRDDNFSLSDFSLNTLFLAERKTAGSFLTRLL